MKDKKFKIDEGQKYEGNNYDGEQKYEIIKNTKKEMKKRRS
jgi:hypothetical protein